MFRVVIDPGVFVSALLSPAGAPAELIREWLSGSFDLIVSRHLLDELHSVLLRPKMRSYVTEEEARQFVAMIQTLTVPKPDPADPPSVCRDPKDDYLFALARENGVELLVSGDADVLDVTTARMTTIGPREFLKRIQEN